jgi:hypothetical protein
MFSPEKKGLSDTVLQFIQGLGDGMLLPSTNDPLGRIARFLPSREHLP